MSDPVLEAVAFAQGLRAGSDPANQGSRLGGRAKTNLHSPWLRRRCPRTGHTFRVDDPVHVDSDGVVTLDPAALLDLTTPEAQAFHAGLVAAWPTEAQVVRLGDPTHPLLAEPTPAFPRRQCAVCGHSFRVGDQVVLCPCSPARPLCAGAVHRDPTRNLTCWDDAQAQMRGRCPVTARRLSDAP